MLLVELLSVAAADTYTDEYQFWYVASSVVSPVFAFTSPSVLWSAVIESFSVPGSIADMHWKQSKYLYVYTLLLIPPISMRCIVLPIIRTIANTISQSFLIFSLIVFYMSLL